MVPPLLVTPPPSPGTNKQEIIYMSPTHMMLALVGVGKIQLPAVRTRGPPGIWTGNHSFSLWFLNQNTIRKRKIIGPWMVTAMKAVRWAPCTSLLRGSLGLRRVAWRANPQSLADLLPSLEYSPGETSCRVMLGKKCAQMGYWWEILQTEERVRKSSCTGRNKQNKTYGTTPY